MANLTRESAVRRLDRLWRPAVFLLLVAALLFVIFLLGNIVHYKYYKRAAQRHRLTSAPINLLPLPVDAERWRLPADNQGDPYDDYLQVQLHFRAHEKEYVTAKLGQGTLDREGLAFAAIDMLRLAATRRGRTTSPEAELALRPSDLRDAAEALLAEAKRLAAAAENSELPPEQADEMVNRAETLIRTYYTTGYYMAEREFLLSRIQVGVEMMERGSRRLLEFYEQQERPQATDVASHLEELAPIAKRLDAIVSHTDDDRDLEVWVRMLESSRSSAVRLFAADRLAGVAKCWWRYGESLRAVRALRQAVTTNYNYPMRKALFELLESVEKGLPLPARLAATSKSDAQSRRRAFDALF